MRAIRIAGLARRVCADRTVPVARVGNDPNVAPVDWLSSSDVLLTVWPYPPRGSGPRSRRARTSGRDRIAQRVREPDVLERILTVLPAIPVGAQPCSSPDKA